MTITAISTRNRICLNCFFLLQSHFKVLIKLLSDFKLNLVFNLRKPWERENRTKVIQNLSTVPDKIDAILSFLSDLTLEMYQYILVPSYYYN